MDLQMQTAMNMHNQAVMAHQQAANDAMNAHMQAVQNSQMTNTFLNPRAIGTGLYPGCFGIIPPKDWEPDKFVGLGPELSPAEKLKKKFEDVRKPMYADVYQSQSSDKPEKKTFKQKVHDFGEKIKEKFQNLAQKIKIAFKKSK